MKQEPKSEKEIKEFASQYGVKFQLFKKIEINGPNTHDVYKYLKWNSELRNGNQVRQMPWNFAKFLVDRNGNVVKFYTSDIEPLGIKEDIKEQLK